MSPDQAVIDLSFSNIKRKLSKYSPSKILSNLKTTTMLESIANDAAVIDMDKSDFKESLSIQRRMPSCYDIHAKFVLKNIDKTISWHFQMVPDIYKNHDGKIGIIPYRINCNDKEYPNLTEFADKEHILHSYMTNNKIPMLLRVPLGLTKLIKNITSWHGFENQWHSAFLNNFAEIVSGKPGKEGYDKLCLDCYKVARNYHESQKLDKVFLN